MIKLIVVARKPLGENSVAENVLKHGTGGINIDECRIGTGQRTYAGSGNSPQKTETRVKGDTGVGLLDGRGRDLEIKFAGRWPANLILQHKPDCRKVGQTKQQVALPAPLATYKPNYRNVIYGKGLGGGFPANFANPNGTETIEHWDCVDGCPVKGLGDQSKGQRCEKPSRTGGPYKNDSFFMPGQPEVSPLRHEDDGGTAARFFKQVGGKK